MGNRKLRRRGTTRQTTDSNYEVEDEQSRGLLDSLLASRLQTVGREPVSSWVECLTPKVRQTNDGGLTL
jgi:hypothetical protein